MNSIGTISPTQILAFFIVNSLGLLFVGLIFWLMRLKTPKTVDKIALSSGLSIISMGIMAILLLNLGIYFWVKSGDYHSAMVIIPITICTIPIVIPISLVGVFIQLVYREKLQSIIYSIVRKEASKKSTF